MKIRKNFAEVKKDFLRGKEYAFWIIYEWLRFILISSVYLLISIIIFLLFSFGILKEVYALIMCFIQIIAYDLFIFYKPAQKLIQPIAFELIKHITKYGYVVTRSDWKRIKKNAPKSYRILNSNKSKGYCYFMSRYIALYLKDVELLYCSMDIFGKRSAHAVIKKGNIIYCTNARMHFDFEEWVKENEVEVYRTFSREEYAKREFFDNINEDLVKWCNERDVYCSPQVSPVRF